MTCRTCKHLNVAPDKAGRRRPIKTHAYRCLFPTPELPALPDSVIGMTDLRETLTKHRRYMEPGDGANCATYEQIG